MDKSIALTEATWKALKQLQLDRGFESMDATINFLFEKVALKAKA